MPFLSIIRLGDLITLGAVALSHWARGRGAPVGLGGAGDTLSLAVHTTHGDCAVAFLDAATAWL